MLDWKQIVDIFGKPNSFEESMLRLSVAKPRFTAKDFKQVLREVTENYLSSADNIEDPTARFNRLYSGKTMLEIQAVKDDPKENLWSTKILKNLCMALESSEPSIDKKKLNKMLQPMKKQATRWLKQRPRSQRLRGIYEFVCEFEERTK